MLDKGYKLTENGTTLGLHGENTFCTGLLLAPCRPFGRIPSVSLTRILLVNSPIFKVVEEEYLGFQSEVEYLSKVEDG